MCLSIPKCKALNISRKKTPTKREYHLNGSPLATVSEIKGLGITVTNTHLWSQHIKLISSKANRTLGLIWLYRNGLFSAHAGDKFHRNLKKANFILLVRLQMDRYECVSSSRNRGGLTQNFFRTGSIFFLPKQTL